MNSFSFWQRWLVVVGWALAVFGLALAFLNQTPLFDLLFNNQIRAAFWPGETPLYMPEVVRFQQWIYGVLGATIAGWGVLFAFVALHPFAERQRWAWNGLAAGIALWFVVDTGVSLYFGVAYNAIVNLVIFIAAALPLAFTYRAFGPRG